jgi:DNA-binding response OmpR family regulator
MYLCSLKAGKMAKKILIIEDDLDILDMMAYILRDEGYEVIVAVDGAPLRDILLLAPDLVLLDNRLGAGEGADACKQLKADPATAAIPVVLISANMHLEALTATSGADGFLAKPFDIDELIALANRYLA